MRFKALVAALFFSLILPAQAVVLYTVGPGKTYPTIAAAVTAVGVANPGTFTDTQEIDVYFQSGGYDEVATAGIVVSGLGATSSFPLIFRAMTSFNGTPGAGVWVQNSGNTGVFKFGTQSNAQVIGFEIQGGTGGSVGLNGSGTGIVFQNDYIASATDTFAMPGAFSVTAYNTIIYGSTTARIFDSRSLTSIILDNDVIGCAGCDLTVISSSEATITNTYAFGGTTDSFWQGGTPAGSHNASDDTSASPFFSSSINSVSTSSAITAVATTWTQKTPSGSNPLVNAGTFLSLFSTDMFGNARPGSSPWDIGPWQHTGSPPAGAASPLTLTGVGN